MNRNTKSSTGSVLNLSHPSVRIKGTETDFSPLNCVDHRCKHNAIVHYHCPFCIKTEVFYDERILKAHYCVKHVDKGIEFAGLKILRCCEHCDMIGVIKGEKRFKSAHWHCFKCRNGFSRRDEAVKHYRTHFKEPYSTFQIYIAQEVNNITGYEECRDDDLDQVHESISDYVAKEANSEAATKQVLGTPVILKGSETSLFGDSLYGQSDFATSALMADNHTGQVENQAAIVIIQQNQDNLSQRLQETESQQKDHLEKLVARLQEDITQLREKKESMEKKLTEEVQYLKQQVNSQENEINDLRQKLLGLHNNNDNHENSTQIDNLISELKHQHTKLLMEQLKEIKKAFSVNTNSAKEKHLTPSSGVISSDSENYLLSNNLEQQNLPVNSNTSRLPGFIIEKNSTLCNCGLSRPYFVVSQRVTNTQKRKYDQMQDQVESSVRKE